MGSQSSAVAIRQETELADVRRFAPPAVVDERTRLLWDQLFFENAEPAEVAFCVAFCEHRDLDPMRGEVVFNRFEKYKDSRPTGVFSVVPVVTAIGYRLQAERTGDYVGQTPREWCGPDGVWKEIWLDDAPPTAARVGILKRGCVRPFYAVAVFKRFVQRYKGGPKKGDPIGVWATNPDVMIATRAETAAFKLAFPDSRGIDARSRRGAIRQIHPGSALRTIDGAIVDVEGAEIFADLADAEAVAERELWVERSRALHDLVGRLHPGENAHHLVHELVCARFGLGSTTEATAEQLAEVLAQLDGADDSPPAEIDADEIEVEAEDARSIDPDTGEVLMVTDRTATAVRNGAKLIKLSDEELNDLAVAEFDVPDIAAITEEQGEHLKGVLTWARNIDRALSTSKLEEVNDKLGETEFAGSVFLNNRIGRRHDGLKAKEAAASNGGR